MQNYILTYPRLIIVEGPDCSGKTTLAKFISKQLKAAYMHATGDRRLIGIPMEAYHRNILENAEVCLESGVSVVLDRHWPSELAYGRALRMDVHLRSGYQSGPFFETIERLKGIYIFCMSPGSMNRQLTSPDQSHPYDREQYNNVLLEYQQLYDGVLCNTWKTSKYILERDGSNMMGYLQRVLEGTI